MKGSRRVSRPSRMKRLVYKEVEIRDDTLSFDKYEVVREARHTS